MTLNAYEVRIVPYTIAGFHGGTEKVYEITAIVNGEKMNVTTLGDRMLPTMNEIEFLNRISMRIIDELRSKYEQDSSVSKDSAHRG